MNGRILKTLILKDLLLYFRNRFFAFVTLAGLIIYIAVYLVLPATVDEALTLAVYAPTVPDIFLDFLTNNDIEIAPFETDEALQAAIVQSAYQAGIVLTGDAVSGIIRGQPATVTVYLRSDAPTELVDALHVLLRLAFNELSATLSGSPLPVQFSEQIVGPDMTGQQISLRSRLLPLMAVILLVMEIMGLGSLISDERESGMLQALLVTPVSTVGLFAAKAIFGIALAFLQATTLMGITGNLRTEPVLILTTLLLASLVVTGLAFLIAAVSRSMMSVIAWGILAMIILLIPAYGVVLPGTVTGWARVIPSFYMFDTIHQLVNLGGASDTVTLNLIVLLVMGVLLMAAGVVVMKRQLT